MYEASKIIDYSILMFVALFIVGKVQVWFKLKTTEIEIVEKKPVWNGFFALSAFFIGVSHGWDGGMEFGHCELHGLISFLGLFFVLAGFILNHLAQRSLGNMWHMDAVVYKDHHVVTTGPYSWFRHPIYLAETLILAGMAMHDLNVAGSFFVALFVIEAKKRMKTEAALLLKHLPEEYGAYIGADEIAITKSPLLVSRENDSENFRELVG